MSVQSGIRDSDQIIRTYFGAATAVAIVYERSELPQQYG